MEMTMSYFTTTDATRLFYKDWGLGLQGGIKGSTTASASSRRSITPKTFGGSIARP
jgi:hypothetical protein